LPPKADHWLRVRPESDVALALSLTNVMIENGWYDADFVPDWTNAADVVDGETVPVTAIRQMRTFRSGPT
jgi:anaerobic selenocysteine-containing dehydrogenase